MGGLSLGLTPIKAILSSLCRGIIEINSDSQRKATSAGVRPGVRGVAICWRYGRDGMECQLLCLAWYHHVEHCAVSTRKLMK